MFWQHMWQHTLLFEKKLCMFVLCTLAAAAAALPPLRRVPAAFSLPAITLAAGGAAPSAPSASSGSSAPCSAGSLLCLGFGRLALAGVALRACLGREVRVRVRVRVGVRVRVRVRVRVSVRVSVKVRV